MWIIFFRVIVCGRHASWVEAEELTACDPSILQRSCLFNEFNTAAFDTTDVSLIHCALLVHRLLLRTILLHGRHHTGILGMPMNDLTVRFFTLLIIICYKASDQAATIVNRWYTLSADRLLGGHSCQSVCLVVPITCYSVLSNEKKSPSNASIRTDDNNNNNTVISYVYNRTF